LNVTSLLSYALLFHIHSLSSPLLRRNVGDRLGKRPAMTSEILDAVLALAVNLVGRGIEDVRAVLPGPLVVTVRIGYTHHNQVGAVRGHISFGQNDASVTRFELNSMVADP
jgi:hypothetical protein